jgi:hypothetical protein
VIRSCCFIADVAIRNTEREDETFEVVVNFIGLVVHEVPGTYKLVEQEMFWDTSGKYVFLIPYVL